jgi:hypothetical protein
MTVGRAAFGWLGWAAALCLSAAAAPALGEGVEGHWRLIGNPYRSRIEVWINATGISANVGCMSMGVELERHGTAVTPSDGLVIEAPCYRAEAREAWGYWQRVERRIADVRSLELKGRRLVLTSVDRRRLVFVRARP